MSTGYSLFGELMTREAGVVGLMDDLSEALNERPDMIMLGGGNPGRVPGVQAALRTQMQAILDDGARFDRLVGDYGPPQGDLEFADALAALLRRNFGWPLTRANIALTNGSQSLSFMLVNLYAGATADGSRRHVLLPLTPEYVGYADQGVSGDVFRANRPRIELLDTDATQLASVYQVAGAASASRQPAPPLFKYAIDFDALRPDSATGAMLVSRPTNPSGNVVTDEEVRQLASIAAAKSIPLILDNAYGLPFPGIVFADATPTWNEHIVLCMSLSKLGLPGVRTGIVIAREDIVRAVGRINAINNLCTASFGPALTRDLVRSGAVLTLSTDHIRPFYAARVRDALAAFESALHGIDYRIHAPEGAIFLWLWFPGLPITSHALYERLKARGVLVLAGESFFPGLAADQPWAHRSECIRVNYAGDPAALAEGARIIGEEVRRAGQG